jgi:benzoyl-CoA reductase subunit C
MKRNFPHMYVDFLHLPHNPSSPAAAQFLAEEYRRLLAELERLGGCKVHEDAIRHSIVRYNRNRALIRELYALRSREPHKVPTSVLYQLIRAGNFLSVELHTEQLETSLAEFRSLTAKARDSIRIVVEGSFCEQPPLTLICLIEDAGCYIVDDDFVLGQSWFESDVPVDGDPALALAASYLDRSSYSSVRHDFRKPRWDGLVEKARRNRADAVLFLIAKFCEPAYFDYVPYKQELERAGIPHLQLEFEEKSFTFDRLRTEIETFVESLVF